MYKKDTMIGKALLPILIALSINNSEYRIMGKVYDNDTKEELVGVRVTSDADTVYTDFDGRFVIKCLNNSTKLIFSNVSYDPDTLNVQNFYNKF